LTEEKFYIQFWNMIHPSSSEDETDTEKAVKEESATVTNAVVRKNSVRSQAKSDSSASFPVSL